MKAGFLLFLVLAVAVFARKRRLLSNGGIHLHNNLTEARHRVERLISLIYRRYEMHTHQGSNLFLASNNINAKTWNIIKWTIASRMLGGHGNSSYLMVFGALQSLLDMIIFIIKVTLIFSRIVCKIFLNCWVLSLLFIILR
jgi:hypothetical protein